MCRLYAGRSTHPRRVGCELLDAQNALVHQSRRDARGLAHPDGWGLGFHAEDGARCLRQIGPAFDSREFEEEVRKVRATTIVAHVRRATVGQPALENTHPFRHEDSLFAHNGHIGNFDRVRPKLLEEMSAEHRDAILGRTDSEHFFHLLLCRAKQLPARSRAEILAGAVSDVRRWVSGSDGPSREVALNVLWTYGAELVGSRVGRTLHYVEREGPHVCDIHGVVHEPPPEGEEYRAIVVASEPITHEAWTPLPEGVVFRVGADLRLEILA